MISAAVSTSPSRVFIHRQPVLFVCTCLLAGPSCRAIPELQSAGPPGQSASTAIRPAPSDSNAAPAAAPGAADAAGTDGNQPGFGTASSANDLMGPATLGPGANAALRALEPAFVNASKRTGVSTNVLAAMAWQESRADPAVAGGGLLQLSDATFAAQRAMHANIGPNIADANDNALAAAYDLVALQALMKAMYGRSDVGIVLRAYNSGENGVDPNDLTRLPAGTGDARYVSLIAGFIAILATGTGELPL